VDVAALLVSWGDGEDLLLAVESLARARGLVPPGGPRVSLAVVFNGRGSVPRRELESLWPGAAVVVNDMNVGFAPAANQAARLVSADVLLFLNPDTRAEGEPFSAIARGFTSHPEAAALAPRLVDFDPRESPDGGHPRPLAPPGREDQFTFQLRRLPTLISDARELLLIDHAFPNNSARRRFRYADEDRERPFSVEQAAAAALAVRSDAFGRIGGFSERFVPAWYEDVDLCDRLAAIGEILYWPEARFRHRGGASSARLGYDRFLPVFYRNALAYRRDRYSWAARASYRALLAAGMTLRLAVLPFRATLPRPRPQAARAYWRVLRLALGLPSPDASP
jgi:GT2 family glycosyltransferase